MWWVLWFTWYWVMKFFQDFGYIFGQAHFDRSCVIVPFQRYSTKKFPSPTVMSYCFRKWLSKCVRSSSLIYLMPKSSTTSTNVIDLVMCWNRPGFEVLAGILWVLGVQTIDHRLGDRLEVSRTCILQLSPGSFLCFRPFTLISIVSRCLVEIVLLLLTYIRALSFLYLGKSPWCRGW